MWRIRANNELNKLIKNRTIIVNYIKAQRLSWFGHINRMTDERLVRRIYKWKPIASRSVGRPKSRWEDEVLKDVKVMNIKSWLNVVKNRRLWKDIVEKAKTFSN